MMAGLPCFRFSSFPVHIKLLDQVHFSEWETDAGSQNGNAGRREVGFSLIPDLGAKEKQKGE